MTKYKGSVDFVAEIKGNGLTFPRFDFNPYELGVDKVEIEGLDGDVIQSTVHLTAMQSREAEISLATKVNTVALNRIAFRENMAIENARVTRDDFSSLDVQPGTKRHWNYSSTHDARAASSRASSNALPNNTD